MNKTLIYILAFLPLIGFSQVKNNAVVYDEFSGYSLDGLSGIQMASIPGDLNPVNYMFGLFGRYNFVAPVNWFSVSAGSPSQLGLNLIASNQGSLLQFTAGIPATIDLNIGARATSENESLIGAFVGGGINYNYTYFKLNNSTINSHAFGPVLHGGFRWTYYGRPLGLRVAHLWGFLNNTELDPTLIIEGRNYPTFLTINLMYGIQ